MVTRCRLPERIPATALRGNPDQVASIACVSSRRSASRATASMSWAFTMASSARPFGMPSFRARAAADVRARRITQSAGVFAASASLEARAVHVFARPQLLRDRGRVGSIPPPPEPRTRVGFSSRPLTAEPDTSPWICPRKLPARRSAARLGCVKGRGSRERVGLFVNLLATKSERVCPARLASRRITATSLVGKRRVIG